MKFPILLIILSLLTHAFLFGQPKAVVFDEIYHGNFISAYSTGNYFFDIHPPFARILIKLVGDMIGVSYTTNFDKIGNVVNDDVIFLRLLPLIAGISLPLIAYYICRRLRMSEITAFLVGVLLCIENSLIVQSRFILFDSLLLLCGFSSLLLYLMYAADRDGKSKKFILLFSALCSSAAFSIKWTGLAFPLLIVVFEIFSRVYDKNSTKFDKLHFLKFISTYVIIGALFYVSVFAIHFHLLTKSGAGDDFMSARFQKSLVGNKYENDVSLKPLNFPEKFVELNTEMYRANARLSTTHPYSSHWYSWPLMSRPIFYWQDVQHAPQSGKYIYFFGNPFIYWLGCISILFLLFYFLYSLVKVGRRINPAIVFIVVGFLVNFLPFIFIGRVMFLYHYEAALVFSILALGLCIDMVPSSKKFVVIASTLVLCILSFVFFSPLTYGLSLTKEQLSHRIWFTTWR